MTDGQPNKTSNKPGGQDGNPFFGYVIFGGLCLIAYLFDVPLAIIIIAVLGYAFSRYSG